MSTFLRSYWPAVMCGAALAAIVVLALATAVYRDTTPDFKGVAPDPEVAALQMKAAAEKRGEVDTGSVRAGKGGRDIFLPGLRSGSTAPEAAWFPLVEFRDVPAAAAVLAVVVKPTEGAAAWVVFDDGSRAVAAIVDRREVGRLVGRLASVADAGRLSWQPPRVKIE